MLNFKNKTFITWAVLTFLLGGILGFFFSSCGEGSGEQTKEVRSSNSEPLKSAEKIGEDRDTTPRVIYRDRWAFKESAPDTVYYPIADSSLYPSRSFTAVWDSTNARGDSGHIEFEYPRNVFKNAYFAFAPDTAETITIREYYQLVVEKMPLFQGFSSAGFDYDFQQVAPTVGVGTALNLDPISAQITARALLKQGVVRGELRAELRYNF